MYPASAEEASWTGDSVQSQAGDQSIPKALNETRTQTMASQARLCPPPCTQGHTSWVGRLDFIGTEHRGALLGIFSDLHCLSLHFSGPGLDPSK